jgi:hypothetical protein
MKKIFLILILCYTYFIANSQCSQYQVYESFGSASVPTQGGTWSQNSVLTVTSPIKTGLRAIGFNGTGDWIRTPQIASPGIFSFWYRRSTNTTAWSCVIETSTNGTTWVSRGTISSITATYQQYTLNLSSLNLSNVFIRVRDTRSSGAQERYIDDMSWTSLNSSQNTLLPILGNCTQSVTSQFTLIDQGSYLESYNNNLNQVVTFTAADPTRKLEINISSLNIETAYDSLYVYDGATTSSPVLAALSGTQSNLSYVTSTSNGKLTIRFKTDVSNIGTWTGFEATINQVLALPVELLYFTGVDFTSYNLLEWATASEKNSEYFDLQNSTNGTYWTSLITMPSANNSNSLLKYKCTHYNPSQRLNYYQLIQYDTDGEYKTYGPIIIDNTYKIKKVVKLINTLGQEVDQNATGILIEVYEDGSMKRIIK